MSHTDAEDLRPDPARPLRSCAGARCTPIAASASYRRPGAVVSTPTCFGAHLGMMAPGENALTATNWNFEGRTGSSEADVHPANANVAAGEIVDPAGVVEGVSA